MKTLFELLVEFEQAIKPANDAFASAVCFNSMIALDRSFGNETSEEDLIKERSNRRLIEQRIAMFNFDSEDEDDDE